MPNILQKYEFQGLTTQNLYLASLTTLQGMNVTQITEGNLQSAKTIDAVIPSIWGWGGMQLGVKIYETDKTYLELKGSIAQAGVSPLTGRMDEFLTRLQEALKSEYNYNFQFEKLTRFLPKYKLHFSKIDYIGLALILVAAAVSTFASYYLNFPDLFFSVPVIAIGYFLGRKFLYSKNK